MIVVHDEHQHDHRQGEHPPPPPPPMPAQTGNGPPKKYVLIDNKWVQLTAAGVPRKKPGRKPGNPAVKSRASDGSDIAKASRKPRKPRDPNAPPMPRKRKIASTGDTDTDAPSDRSFAAIVPRQPRVSDISNLTNSSPVQQPMYQQHTILPEQQRSSPKMLKREHFPGSMQNILNSDPPQPPPQSSPPTTTTVPVRTSGQSYDPIRGGQSYDPIRGKIDPVRESIVSHNSYASASGSPRAPTQMPTRSPTIANLLEPSAPSTVSPNHTHSTTYQPASSHPRYQAQEPSVPPSPSNQPGGNSTPTPASRPLAPAPVVTKNPPAAPPPPPAQRPVIRESNFTTISNGPIRRVSPKQKAHTGVSTPKTDNLDDLQESEGRSILDFGRAKPGEEQQTPTITLTVPIKAGETNKYVNFMRMAEDRYGWDALHPRLAADRDRKARIAAAAASLEKAESGRESGDEMSVDLSDGEGSNPENGGTSGPDAQAKPKKKRNFKEDQYDVDDDFVDDSELLWEAQAAASRDGFFVYSGPLVPEVEKPAAGHDGPPKRGRGGRGSRGGGRGASTRGGAGSGRGGGPGSRGGSITRKPRITKSEKAQREREKAERESMLSKTPSHGYSLQPTTPSFAVSELGA